MKQLHWLASTALCVSVSTIAFSQDAFETNPQFYGVDVKFTY